MYFYNIMLNYFKIVSYYILREKNVFKIFSRYLKNNKGRNKNG